MPDYTEAELAIARKYEKVVGHKVQPGFIDSLRILCGPDMKQQVGEYMAEKALIIIDRGFDVDSLNQKGYDLATISTIESGTDLSEGLNGPLLKFGVSCGISVTLEEVMSEHLRYLRHL